MFHSNSRSAAPKGQGVRASFHFKLDGVVKFKSLPIPGEHPILDLDRHGQFNEGEASKMNYQGHTDLISILSLINHITTSELNR
jgi:hypothetical protein